jgi:hypothetical protein
MKNPTAIGALIIIMAAVVTLAALTLPARAQTYQEIKTITGSSDQTTDYFTVSSNEWRISWSCTPSASYPESAVFSLFIYPKGESTFYTDSILKMGAQETSGTTYIHEGQKDYYLKLGAANIEGYTIKIEQETPVPTPTIPEFPASAAIAAALILAAAGLIVLKQNKKNV